jgi:hypothetical protein
MRGNFERNMSYWRWYRSLTFTNVLGLTFLLEGLGVFLLPLSILTCIAEQYLFAYIEFSFLVVLYFATILAILDKFVLSLKLVFAIPMVLVALIYIAVSIFTLTMVILPELFNLKGSFNV